MKDRYLFKAKVKEEPNDWVEGYLVVITDANGGEYRIATEEDMRWSYTNYSDYDGVMTIVDKETVCQYTGLNDRNGNKIWENDILFACEPYIPTVPFSVRYNYETVSYVGLYDGFEKAFELKADLLTSSEVIGNIFDNPELKEGAK